MRTTSVIFGFIASVQILHGEEAATSAAAPTTNNTSASSNKTSSSSDKKLSYENLMCASLDPLIITIIKDGAVQGYVNLSLNLIAKDTKDIYDHQSVIIDNVFADLYQTLNVYYQVNQNNFVLNPNSLKKRLIMLIERRFKTLDILDIFIRELLYIPIHEVT